MPSPLRTHLEHALRGMPPRPLHIGFSGGVDSTALLHLLSGIAAARDAGLRAIHVHHGLSPQADAWAAHCRRVCDALAIPLTVLRVEVARDGGEGPEAAARKARHAAFGSVLGEDEVLVTAHHRDDQAETFLLRALRASGPDGLGAMRPLRKFGRCWLWRPLLGIPRSALSAYAREQDLSWIEDASNDDVSLDRNYLRHRVLPLLRERWPHADPAFALSAALCAESSALLADGDVAALADVRSLDPNALDAERLERIPMARRARVLRHWIEELALPPLPAQGIAAIEQDLIEAEPDAEAAFAWSGAVVRRWRGLLHADWQRPALPVDWSTEWDGRTPLTLPDGGELALEGADRFDRPLRAHARQGGERIALPGRDHSHALKHVLQDLGVPPWERTRLPLLSDGVDVFAAGDLVYSAAFDTWLRERGARLVWRIAASSL
ncbi:tRNA lysidine(34) synthetase TilS [Luteimonas sp. SX5]|uniref:tRNA(Ile)-lysidine synthase n=1 Tax=Luteimonas galliterrae TaxID=2940486 RepID=A0ABT0ME55_9GAMM|nr:tRNA lysidine(34) synthetase TilS [Luteimonas galliterrae]MCL1633152.1 tRNA lysidine(34) synthetase TilS [Luteimonas galliterrae]